MGLWEEDKISNLYQINQSKKLIRILAFVTISWGHLFDTLFSSSCHAFVSCYVFVLIVVIYCSKNKTLER